MTYKLLPIISYPPPPPPQGRTLSCDMFLPHFVGTVVGTVDRPGAVVAVVVVVVNILDVVDVVLAAFVPHFLLPDTAIA